MVKIKAKFSGARTEYEQGKVYLDFAVSIKDYEELISKHKDLNAFIELQDKKK